MLDLLQGFLADEAGATAIEYGLIVSSISLVIIPSVKDVGSKLVDIFTALQNAFN